MTVIEPYEPNCSGNCACSNYEEVLGLDSSHLFLLARSAAVDAPGSTSSHRLMSLLHAHGCAGRRRLVTSATCLDGECFRRPGATSIVADKITISDICSGVTYDEMLAIIDVLQDTEPSDLPQEVKVQDSVLSFDRGERSLVQVTRAIDGAIIVTNDEDAFDIIKELAMTDTIGQFPVMSVALAEYMYNCQALTADQAGLICDQAVATMNPGISMVKKKRKERHAAEVVQRIAIAEETRLLDMRKFGLNVDPAEQGVER